MRVFLDPDGSRCIIGPVMPKESAGPLVVPHDGLLIAGGPAASKPDLLSAKGGGELLLARKGAVHHLECAKPSVQQGGRI